MVKCRFSVASQGVNLIRAIPVSEEAGLLPLKSPTTQTPGHLKSLSYDQAWIFLQGTAYVGDLAIMN
jgi:hypothetical protein